MHSANHWGGSFEIHADGTDDEHSRNMDLDRAALSMQQQQHTLDETQQSWLLGPQDGGKKKDKYVDLGCIIVKRKVLWWVLWALLAAFIVIGVPIIVVKTLPKHKEKPPPPDEYSKALRKALMFFNAQRSGHLPKNNGVPWRGNSGLKDGADLTDVKGGLVGGYYDAGDNIKFHFPMAFSMSMLSWSVIEYSDRYKALGEYDHVRDIIKWGTDYLLKTFNSSATTIDKVHSQVGVGRNGTTTPDDHYCWMRPEDMDYPRPVTTSSTAPDLGAEMAAALASASIVFRDDTAYSKKLIKGAAAVYKFARSNGRRTPYSRGVQDIAQFYNSSGYWDEYMWSAAWMYYATGQTLEKQPERMGRGRWWRLWAPLVLALAAAILAECDGRIPTTLEGPFAPVTAVLGDGVFRGNAVDLPDDDPRVRRKAKGFEPEQISISLSATHNSVWISWITGDSQMGYDVKPLDPKTVASVVRYGRHRNPLHRHSTGYSLVYSQLYSFEGLRNYTSGIIHHVRLTGLEPGTIYFYRCGDPSIAMSNTHVFKTMPVSGPRSYPKRIAIVGDLGLTYNTTSTVGHMRSNLPDLILLVGDVTYANMYLTNGTGSNCYSCSFRNTPIHESYQPRWDYWGRFMEPTLSEIPIMVIEGNHELEEQAEYKTFASYSSRFAFPSEESGSFSTFYYSFNAGGIHFIMLGGYTSYKKSGEQYKWLERDLSNVDRTVTPWLIATWHPPWYSSYKAHYREAECMKVEMEELLYSYGVDVVFNGHVHAYERSNRVYNYTLDPCGPLHIMVGDGGNREKIATSYADEAGHCPDPRTTPDWTRDFCAFNFTTGPAAGKFCWDRQPDYSAYRESSFGHGILEVKNETYALWTWHRNQDMYKSHGDQIYIVRQPDKCPLRPSKSHVRLKSADINKNLPHLFGEF